MLGYLRKVLMICQGSITCLFTSCDNTSVLSFQNKDVVNVMVEEIVLGSWGHKHLASPNWVSEERMCKFYHVIKSLGLVFRTSE